MADFPDFKCAVKTIIFYMTEKTGEQTLHLNRVVLVRLTEEVADSRPWSNSQPHIAFLLLLLPHMLLISYLFARKSSGNVASQQASTKFTVTTRVLNQVNEGLHYASQSSKKSVNVGAKMENQGERGMLPECVRRRVKGTLYIPTSS